MRLYDDHLWINSTATGEMAWMRTKYFMDKLEGLDEFWGFFPRTYLPQTKLFFYEAGMAVDDPVMTKVTLFIIDSK